ncbi:MAG TPA: 5'-deoxynucleotidase [Lachnospiraceae bacterium]|nr:5'-deoxynucleotidase [Lachnospiraceae bacterium]
MTYNFFATLSRMKYIERWALMRNARTETLSEHTLDVAMIAHALCVIGNVRFGRKLNADRAALVGLYHDASEIITGDMPTPVKYYNRDIRDAYKEVEHMAERRLVSQLPEDLRGAYMEIFEGAGAEEDRYMRKLVKAADKLSALIKCMEETGAGNGEFRSAQLSTQRAVEEMAGELPEVKVFLEEFLPPYGSTLDELLGRA